MTRFLRHVATFFLIGIISCGVGEIRYNVNSKGATFEEMQHDWSIDSEFTADQQAIVIEAFDRWSCATDGMIFPGTFVIEPVDAFQPFGVARVDQNAWFVLKQEEEKTKEKGYPFSVAGANRKNSIYIVRDRGESVAVVMHEIGHFLGLEHNSLSGNLMNEAAGEPCVSQELLDELCSFKDCSTYEMHATCGEDVICEL